MTGWCSAGRRGSWDGRCAPTTPRRAVVVTIGRTGADLAWTDAAAGIARAVDGASLVVRGRWAGKSVNCRYTERNRDEITSRLTTQQGDRSGGRPAAAVGQLRARDSLAGAGRDRPVRSPTTANRHGILVGGCAESVGARVVARAPRSPGHPSSPSAARSCWAATAASFPSSPAWRRLGRPRLDGWWPVARRRRPRRRGRPPAARGGRQRFQLGAHRGRPARHPAGPSRTHNGGCGGDSRPPGPVESHDLMAAVRQRVGARVSFPMPRWMLEISALARGTETELILKSRWVLPRDATSRATARVPTLGAALDDLLT